jgi:alpha-L-rhamnosidase
MNSFNHYAYGAVAEWLYSGMCGIKPDTEMPGWEHFFLAPTPDMRSDDELPEGQKRINMARAAYESVMGRIESSWVNVDGRFEYSFLIPEESAATVSLVSEKDTFKINGIEFKLEEMNGRRQGDRILFPLSEGAYTVVIG